MMALRGVLGLVLAIALVIGVIAYGAGALSTDPRVVSDVPPQSVGITERSTVEYRGVVVGAVESVRSDAQRTRLTLKLSPNQVANIPAGVKTRILPRTLFGDQYIDLVPPAQPAGKLSISEAIPADTSGDTIELYTAYRRLFAVLQAVQPAKISTALAAVSEALTGRGERLGRMIDQAHDLTDDAPALLQTFSDTLGFVSDLSSQLSDVAPQGIQALKDATALSQSLMGRKGDIEALLTGGLALSGQAQKLLGDNKDRLIQMVDSSGKVLDTTARHASGLGDLYDGFDLLMNNLQGVLSQGPWLPTEVDVTLAQNRPYTGADCPRYGKLAGPNCGAAGEPPAPPPTLGGVSGPVGSEQEADTLAQFADRLPGALPASASRDGILALLAGPILRGTKVLVP